MLARVATFNTLPDDLDSKAVDRLREIVRSTPGYVGGFHLRNSISGKGCSIVVVEDADSMAEIGRRLEARSTAERVGIEPDHQEFFDAEIF